MIDKTPGYIFTTRILILSFCLWFEDFLHPGQDPLVNVVDVDVGVILLGQRLAVGQRDLVGHLLIAWMYILTFLEGGGIYICNFEILT